MNENKTFQVTNRSAGLVCYAIPEIGVKNREFQPGETKKISYEELNQLTYIPGGIELLRSYLQVQDEAVRTEVIGHTEPEYNMSVADVKELILHGTMDEWLDCLDFAPDGVIDLIRTLSIELPLTDTRKMEAFKEKKNIDLSRAIAAKREEEEELKAAQEQSEQRERRAAKAVEPEKKPAAPTERRTTGSKYNVVKKAE
jgi:hypothetical protein